MLIKDYRHIEKAIWAERENMVDSVAGYEYSYSLNGLQNQQGGIWVILGCYADSKVVR